MFVIIPNVDSASCAKLRTTPPFYVISATGTVPTTGWTKPGLAPHVYVTPPNDGVQEFTFHAHAPQFGATVPCSIDAHWIGLLPKWVKAIRVVSASNAEETDCGDDERAEVRHFSASDISNLTASQEDFTPLWPIEVAGGEVPWPL